MCGIGCYFCPLGTDAFSATNLNRRGPDSHQSCTVNFEDYTIVFLRYLLHMRGDAVCVPSIQNPEVGVFLFNGELYNSDVDESHGDTVHFWHSIKSSGVIATCQGLVGEYAFVFYDALSNSLWFARDCLGRRSLLLLLDTQSAAHSSFAALASVCELSYSNSVEACACTAYEVPSEGLFQLTLAARKDDVVNIVFHPYRHNWCEHSSPFIESWNKMRSVFNLTIAARPVLLNDATFCMAADAPSCHHCCRRLLTAPVCRCDLVKDIPAETLQSVVHKFLQLLRRSVERRVCLMRRGIRCALLFSGGLDCTVLARLMHEFYPKHEPIELVNVAFQVDGGCCGDTPDRITANMALRELQRTQPGREWKLVCVDVTKAQLQHERNTRIRHVLYPCRTVLDDSIGCALWFAARGASGTVLLSGMGADEQLGGYSSHRAAFLGGGWQQLHSQLASDLHTIALRNMGRDDRVVADHGKELRTPYLDEELVLFLSSLPPWHKTNPLAPRHTGDKYLLREVAKQLSLAQVATLAKRAIQFGSRIAKLEKRKEKASDACSRLATQTQ